MPQSGDGANRPDGEHPADHGHPRTNGTNGAHPTGMNARPIILPAPRSSDHDLEGEPVDLVTLQADDELINALASGLSVSGTGEWDIGSDDRMCAVLAAWKAEIDAEPIPELVELDTAVATVQAARRPQGRVRHLAPVAAAAAAVVALLGGLSLGSYSAEPDDVLWPVAKVLYSERTTSVEAADRVEQHIARAKQAIAAGQPAVAEQELRAAAADLALVRPEEGRVELVEVQQFLKAKASETTPGVPTDPGAPLVGDRTRRVPPGAELAAPARTPETSPPADRPAEESAPAGPATVEDEQPAAPSPAEPVAPEPAPADPPEVAKEPAEDSSAPVDDPSDTPGRDEPVDPQPAPEEPAPPAADSGASDPEAPSDSEQSIGATSADSESAAPSSTS